MKRSFNFLLILGITFGLLACDAADKFTQFDMDYQQSVTVESNSSVNLPFNVFSPDIETNSESTFEVNDTRKDLVEEITLTSLTLTLESPTNSDFSFLESVAIYLNAEGLEEAKVAWQDEVADNSGTSMSLSVTGDDLKEFIKKDEFSIRVNTVTDEIFTQDHEILVDAQFFVDAKILGQ